MEPRAFGSFDYVVIGAGSAGCVLASRLSEDPTLRVLLLETGGPDDWHWIHIPAGLFYSLGNPRTDWCYTTEPEPGLDGRKMPIARGRVLGGSSSINGMAYVRGQAADYDDWLRTGNPGWGWSDVLPYFMKSEDYAHGPDAFHGVGGPLRVEEPRMRWTVLDDLREAAAQVGLPKIDDFNRGDNEGCGYLQLTQRRGRRCSTARGFLRPAQHRPNLTVLTRAPTTRIRIEGDRAVAVEFLGAAGPQVAQVQGEVIVSAGTYGSPQLLQLSGIGPAALLREHGIAVHRELPGVGENLQDHVNARFIQRLASGDTMNTRLNNPLKKMLMGIEYFLLRQGPMTNGAPPLSGFAKSDPSRGRPNVQFHATTASYESLGTGPHPFPVIAGGICNLRPRSRGFVRIQSADPSVYPALLHNYLVDEDDQRVALDSVRLMRRIFGASALAGYEPQDYMPPGDCTADEALLAQIRAKAWTAFHPVGTCKMGRDAMAVVDERLRVRGVAQLRVVDASIMPTLVSGNTNAPAIMIAEKGADMILKDRRASMSAVA